jgi:hypothetical protein
MTLIETEYLSNAGPVWINPRAIVKFRPDREGTEITLLEGPTVSVKVAPDRLAALIGDDAVCP